MENRWRWRWERSALLLFSFFIIFICFLDIEAGRVNQSYGVYLDVYSKKQRKKLSKHSILTLTPSDHSPAQIRKLGKNRILYGYLNCGALEKYSPYYRKYKKYKLCNYDGWADEIFIKVTKKKWRDHIARMCLKLKKQGFDGVFMDNLDVYSLAPKKAQNDYYLACVEMVKSARSAGLRVMVNGADEFVTKAIQTGDIRYIDAITQEEVFTLIKSDGKNHGSDRYTKQKAKETKRLTGYLQRVQRQNVEVYLLEYTRNKNLKKRIRKYCEAHGYGFYIARSSLLR